MTSKKFEIPEELLREWKEEDEKAREIRRKEANWDFINSLPPKLKYALIYLIEKGDRYVAAKIAGISIEELEELRRKANIPIVI